LQSLWPKWGDGIGIIKRIAVLSGRLENGTLNSFINTNHLCSTIMLNNPHCLSEKYRQ
jgi:hypothetical protein